MGTPPVKPPSVGLNFLFLKFSIWLQSLSRLVSKFTDIKQNSQRVKREDRECGDKWISYPSGVVPVTFSPTLSLSLFYYCPTLHLIKFVCNLSVPALLSAFFVWQQCLILSTTAQFANGISTHHRDFFLTSFEHKPTLKQQKQMCCGKWSLWVYVGIAYASKKKQNKTLVFLLWLSWLS